MPGQVFIPIGIMVDKSQANNYFGSDLSPSPSDFGFYVHVSNSAKDKKSLVTIKSGSGKKGKSFFHRVKTGFKML